MDLWEDELLLDDDFSDEEEESEELSEDEALDLAEDGFADWADASDGAGAGVFPCIRRAAANHGQECGDSSRKQDQATKEKSRP